MSDERPFTLRQIDQARGDLYALQDDLDFIRVQLARLPTRNEVWRAAMLGMLGGAVAAVTPAAGALAPSADFGVSSGSEPGTVNVPYQPPSPPPPPEMRAPDGTEPRSSSPESDDGGHLHNEPPEIEGPSEGPEVPE